MRPAPTWMGFRVAWEIEGVRSRAGFGTWTRRVKDLEVGRLSGVGGASGVGELRDEEMSVRETRIRGSILGFCIEFVD